MISSSLPDMSKYHIRFWIRGSEETQRIENIVGFNSSRNTLFDLAKFCSCVQLFNYRMYKIAEYREYDHGKLS